MIAGGRERKGKDGEALPPADDASDIDVDIDVEFEADVEARAGAAIVPRPSAMPNEHAPVIVVADDDSDIRAMLVRALGTTYTVYEARDGEEARAMLSILPAPDAIVCDIMMPRLDGLGLAKAIRLDPVLQRVPILFLTARGAPLDVVTGINAGARHYVTKPFRLGDVVAKISAMTSSAKR